jgi:predicted ATP-grasp superfamily ATP-dependent carboligase
MTYEIVHEPPLERPVLISALAGWVDAAGVGSSAIGRLADGAERVATFDSDLLFDYRSQRPILDIVEGRMVRAVWPEVAIDYAQVGGRDLLLLTGLEPDLAWRMFSRSVGDVASKFGVTQLITLGSVPAAVPHTLPPPVMTTASDKALLEESARPPEGLLRVPAAAVSMIDMHLAERGFDTVGFFVQVPHYVTSPYPSGIAALLRRVELHLGMSISLDDLDAEAQAHRDQLDEIVAQQPEAAEHVRQLETMNAEQQAISGEDLANEIERYLKKAAPGDQRRRDDEES